MLTLTLTTIALLALRGRAQHLAQLRRRARLEDQIQAIKAARF